MSITVKVSDLLKIATKLTKDDIEYVELAIIESELFEGDVLPATLNFDAYDGEGGGIDYESIEEVKISATYKFD
ncbi:hypothetical protein COJ46_22145 [Bacillus sp. AFS077874]|uniref:hypothetical protein n=1 Tax=Bacillus sp. AFS077874 TaxID=2033513 RepID=UPI000BF45AAC|nr:hypothetical protein [Bacillus sp. AFS077874]PFM75256.1 hypothetical protein COJ46_22145 [Bacillus sp. AFS077874]